MNVFSATNPASHGYLAIKLRALLRYLRIPFDWVIMTRALRKQAGHLERTGCWEHLVAK